MVKKFEFELKLILVKFELNLKVFEVFFSNTGGVKKLLDPAMFSFSFGHLMLSSETRLKDPIYRQNTSVQNSLPDGAISPSSTLQGLV